jgi:hypothetical protein
MISTVDKPIACQDTTRFEEKEENKGLLSLKKKNREGRKPFQRPTMAMRTLHAGLMKGFVSNRPCCSLKQTVK